MSELDNAIVAHYTRLLGAITHVGEWQVTPVCAVCKEPIKVKLAQSHTATPASAHFELEDGSIPLTEIVSHFTSLRSCDSCGVTCEFDIDFIDIDCLYDRIDSEPLPHLIRKKRIITVRTKIGGEFSTKQFPEIEYIQPEL